MQVNLPDNIQKYTLKAVGGLTKRQAAHLALAALLFGIFAVISIVWLPGVAGKILGILAAALISVPILIAGFYSYMGLSLIEVLRRFRQQMSGKEYRPYRGEGN